MGHQPQLGHRLHCRTVRALSLFLESSSSLLAKSSVLSQNAEREDEERLAGPLDLMGFVLIAYKTLCIVLHMHLMKIAPVSKYR